MAHTWFRFYNEVVDDPKVQRLTPPIFKTWVNFMCIASKHGGVLPEIEDVAYRLHVTKTRAESLQNELIKANLFEWQDGRCVPHNWTGRQFQSDVSTDRVKRFRNGKRNVSETPDETDQIQNRAETETEQKPLKPLAGPKYSAEFEEFWAKSTKRGSKAEAYKVWRILKPDAALQAEINAGMQAWMGSDQWQDENMQTHINRWLKRRGWEEIVPKRARAASATGIDNPDYYAGIQ